MVSVDTTGELTLANLELVADCSIFAPRDFAVALRVLVKFPKTLDVTKS